MKAKVIMEDIARTRANFKKASSRLWDYLEEKNEFRDPLDPLTLGTDGEILLELAHIAARKEMEAKNLADQLIGSLEDERAEMILRLLLKVKCADNLAHAPEYRDRSELIDQWEQLLNVELASGSCFSLGQLAV